MEEKRAPKIDANNGKLDTYFHPGIGHAKGRGGKTKEVTFEIADNALIINEKKKFSMEDNHRYFINGVAVTENPLGYEIKDSKDGSNCLSFSDPIKEKTTINFSVAEDFDIDGASVRDVLLLIEDHIEKRNDVYLTKDEAIAALKAMAPIIYFKKLPVDHGRIDISSYAQYGFKCQAIGMTHNEKLGCTECLLQFYLPEVK